MIAAPTGSGKTLAAHHGSLAREQRLAAEQRLKSGSLRALVATASLELGLDVGGVEEWTEEELFAAVRRAWPFRELRREDFDAVVKMLAEGFTAKRGRRGALIHRDAVNRRLRGRRGARLMAMTSGGAIPDNADFQVVLDPAELVIGSVNEDFAVESMAGDIFQLGNASWRILRIEPGKVRAGPQHPNSASTSRARHNECRSRGRSSTFQCRATLMRVPGSCKSRFIPVQPGVSSQDS